MRILNIGLLIVAVGGPVIAQDVTTPVTPPSETAPAVAAEIGDVIDAQLLAFKSRNIEGAWVHASQNIQRLFGNPDQFGLMVQQLYPMVWDNSDARYVSQRAQDGYVFQQVMIQDPQGRLHMLEYAMIKTPDGWRIDGVSILPQSDVGV